MRHTLTVVVIAALFPAGAVAQTNATKPPVPHNQVVSLNPFGLIFEWYNAEYERKIGDAATLGVSASHFAAGDMANALLLARWYPQRAALDGFYLGARAGAYVTKTRTYEYHPTPPPRPAPNNPTPTYQTYSTYPTYREQKRVVPGVGLEIGYNWLLGPKQNLSIGLGFGVTRLLQSGDGDDFFMPPVLPGVRFVNIGIAF
jgi:hypothetical protein